MRARRGPDGPVIPGEFSDQHRGPHRGRAHGRQVAHLLKRRLDVVRRGGQRRRDPDAVQVAAGVTPSARIVDANFADSDTASRYRQGEGAPCRLGRRGAAEAPRRILELARAVGAVQ